MNRTLSQSITGLVLTLGLSFGAQAIPTFSVLTSYAYPQLNAGSSSALTFDGTELLFLTQQAGAEDIYFLDPLTGAVSRQITPASSVTIGAMTWDGANIRAANVTTGAGSIRTINPLTGAEGASTPVPPAVGTRRVEGLAFDGSSLFLSVLGGAEIFEIDPTTGNELNSYALASALYGLTWGGGDVLYGASLNTSEIVAIDKGTGALMGSFAAPGLGTPHGLAYDGINLYVADQGSDTIYVLAPTDVPAPGTLLLLAALAPLPILARRRRHAAGT